MLPRKYGKMQLQEVRMPSEMVFFNRNKPDEIKKEKVVKKLKVKTKK